MMRFAPDVHRNRRHTVIAYIPLLAAVVGVLLYALASNAKIQEVGRIMFACGFLVTMFVLAEHVIKLLAS